MKMKAVMLILNRLLVSQKSDMSDIEYKRKRYTKTYL